MKSVKNKIDHSNYDFSGKASGRWIMDCVEDHLEEIIFKGYVFRLGIMQSQFQEIEHALL